MVCALALGLAVAGGPLRAADADPAAQQITAFDRALVEVMKEGPTLGAKGRFRRLAPVVERTFDLPAMTHFAVGPTWASMPQADQQALIEAFTRLSVASYAHNFDHFAGERFDVAPVAQARGAERIVQSHLIPAQGAPVSLVYRMRQSGGAWKIIDVYYGAISQLTTRRADFAGPLAAGGAKGLVAHLDALSDKLLR
jgi:phospholipid transport system substrate-binding protein